MCPPGVTRVGVAKSKSNPRVNDFRGVEGKLLNSSGCALVPQTRWKDAKCSDARTTHAGCAAAFRDALTLVCP